MSRDGPAERPRRAAVALGRPGSAHRARRRHGRRGRRGCHHARRPRRPGRRTSAAGPRRPGRPHRWHAGRARRQPAGRLGMGGTQHRPGLGRVRRGQRAAPGRDARACTGRCAAGGGAVAPRGAAPRGPGRRPGCPAPSWSGSTRHGCIARPTGSRTIWGCRTTSRSPRPALCVNDLLGAPARDAVLAVAVEALARAYSAGSGAARSPLASGTIG